MKEKPVVFVCLVICVLALCVTASNVIQYYQSQPTEAYANSNYISSSEIEEMFDVRNMALTSIDLHPKSVDFGTVNSDTILTARFSIRNMGTELLCIQRLKADCTCTSVSSNKDFASPGDSIIITMTLNTKGKDGDNTINATFMANTKELNHKMRMIARIHHDEQT